MDFSVTGFLLWIWPMVFVLAYMILFFEYDRWFWNCVTCIAKPGEGKRRRLDEEDGAELTQLQNKHSTSVCSPAKVATKEHSPGRSQEVHCAGALNFGKGRLAATTEGTKYVVKPLSGGEAWAMKDALFSATKQKKNKEIAETTSICRSYAMHCSSVLSFLNSVCMWWRYPRLSWVSTVKRMAV